MSQSESSSASSANPVAGWQLIPLLLLRLAVGWHFLYEGLSKLSTPDWTAEGYLAASKYGFFQWLAESEGRLGLVNFLNVWGLILIGACLMLGLLTRFSAVMGMALLALYYLAHPPLFGSPVGPAEGSYLLVNKNLIELFALAVVFAYPATAFGLDAVVFGWWKLGRGRMTKTDTGAVEAGLAGPVVVTHSVLARRRLLAAMAGLPFVGVFVLAVLKKRGFESHEEKNLAATTGESGTGLEEVDATSGATVKRFEFVGPEKLKQTGLPMGTIGDGKVVKKVELSRMILGGNLIGGWAHARDLIYVSKLVKAYHHRGKIFETLALAEQCGVNTILTNPILCEFITDYWKEEGGKIQFISDCGGSPDKLIANIKLSIDNGAAACYVQGGTADRMVREGKFDLFEEALEVIREAGIPAGIGAHKIGTIQACVEREYLPDFWMKTLHHNKYWSATPTEEKDNIWCENSEETIALMNTRPEPWIAFKTLAAGAIPPKVGFKYAFKNGADFICVGMYDFQIVEDVNLAAEELAAFERFGGTQTRVRPWIA